MELTDHWQGTFHFVGESNEIRRIVHSAAQYNNPHGGLTGLTHRGVLSFASPP